MPVRGCFWSRSLIDKDFFCPSQEYMELINVSGLAWSKGQITREARDAYIICKLHNIGIVAISDNSGLGKIIREEVRPEDIGLFVGPSLLAVPSEPMNKPNTDG